MISHNCNGYLKIDLGTRKLEKKSKFKKIENNSILILVTHDAIVAPFINFYFNEWFDENNWVDFLDGVFITKKSNQITMNRNNLQYGIH